MKKIKERRAKINISQEELAKKMGVAQSTVSMWETGEVTPPTKRLCELAHTLNGGVLSSTGCTAVILTDCQQSAMLSGCLKTLRNRR